jgi:hypothetical protein
LAFIPSFSSHFLFTVVLGHLNFAPAFWWPPAETAGRNGGCQLLSFNQKSKIKNRKSISLLLHQIHSALGAFPRFVLHYFRVHRARILNRFLALLRWLLPTLA